MVRMVVPLAVSIILSWLVQWSFVEQSKARQDHTDSDRNKDAMRTAAADADAEHYRPPSVGCRGTASPSWLTCRGHLRSAAR